MSELAPERMAMARMRSLLLWRSDQRSPTHVLEHLTAMQAQEHRYALWSIAQRAGSSPDAAVLDAAFDWFADDGRAGPASPRIDLVQCYDEVIISYRESRDIISSPQTNFPVPRHVDGFIHVVLLDGQLLGHWRPVTGRGELRVETRIGRRLRPAERAALAEAVDRYRLFAESGL